MGPLAGFAVKLFGTVMSLFESVIFQSSYEFLCPLISIWLKSKFVIANHWLLLFAPKDISDSTVLYSES